MKIFNTLQELWDYSRFCPVCQDSSRNVRVELGPSPHTLINVEKTNNQLTIESICKLRRQKYAIVFNIDCNTSAVKAAISGGETSEPDESAAVSVDKPYSYIKLMGDCPKCQCTHSTSSDIELDLLNKTLGPISLDREGIYLLDHKDKFHITIIYDRKAVLVSRCSVEPDDSILDDNKVLELPMINLDFSDQEKVINKIKTLILFS
jgi:hypothetical protein